MYTERAPHFDSKKKLVVDVQNVLYMETIHGSYPLLSSAVLFASKQQRRYVLTLVFLSGFTFAESIYSVKPLMMVEV